MPEESVPETLARIEAKIDATRNVLRFCRHCGGTGNKTITTPPGGVGSCVNCGGTGRKKIGEMA